MTRASRKGTKGRPWGPRETHHFCWRWLALYAQGLAPKAVVIRLDRERRAQGWPRRTRIALMAKAIYEHLPTARRA